MRRQRTFIGPQGMAGMVGLWGASSLIKSIQRGTISITSGATSNTATIAAVDPNNTRIVFLNTIPPSGGGTETNACRVALTNSTTVTAFVNSTGASDRIVGYEVIEYLPGVIKSVQRGTLATSAAASGTATITAVDMNKATLDHLGYTMTTSANVSTDGWFKLILTDSTTVTGNGLSAYTRTAGYQVIEWF